MELSTDANGLHESPAFWAQRDQYKAAIKAALLLNRPLDYKGDKLDATLVAAVNQAFENNVVDFQYTELKGQVDIKQVMEQALKFVSLEIVNASHAAASPLMEYKPAGATVPSMRQLLDLTQCLAHIQLVDAVALLNILQDTMECVPVRQGAELFQYIEQCVPFMRANFEFESSKAPKLRLLSLCNNLMARISRVQHGSLAGRIHLLLSQLLPSSDRSAVNVSGNVNEANPVAVEEVPEGAVDTRGEPVNADFYQTFWSLQASFQNPRIAMDPSPWTKVRDAIRQVLVEFQKVKCTVTGGNSPGLVAGDVNQDNLTVRYISSPKLLSLQVRDAEFRRLFLLQCLILLQAGLKPASAKPDTPAFKIKQQGEAEDLEKLIYAELERTPENGAQFSKSMRRVMQREDQWADWKASGAHSFERSPRPLLTHQRPPKRRRLNLRGDAEPGQETAQPSEAKAIGSPPKEEAPESMETETNDEEFGFESTPASRALRKFLQPVIEEMDPEEGIEEAYKRKKDVVYKWESLRQVAKVSYKDFVRVTTTGDLEEAVRLLFQKDVPAGARAAPETKNAIPDLGALTNVEAAQVTDAGVPRAAATPEPLDTVMEDAGEVLASEEEGELPEDNPPVSQTPSQSNIQESPQNEIQPEAQELQPGSQSEDPAAGGPQPEADQSTRSSPQPALDTSQAVEPPLKKQRAARGGGSPGDLTSAADSAAQQEVEEGPSALEANHLAENGLAVNGEVKSATKTDAESVQLDPTVEANGVGPAKNGVKQERRDEDQDTRMVDT